MVFVSKDVEADSDFVASGGWTTTTMAISKLKEARHSQRGTHEETNDSSRWTRPE